MITVTRLLFKTLTDSNLLFKGDPNLGIDQVVRFNQTLYFEHKWFKGVPRSIALNLTFPERVTKFNIDALKV